MDKAQKFNGMAFDSFQNVLYKINNVKVLSLKKAGKKTMKKLPFTTSALAAAFSVVALESATAEALQMEKCQITGYNKEGKEVGLIKAHKADCKSAKGSCAGENDAGDPLAWIYLPQGLCEKIEGSHVVQDKK